jgi:hypothetical protein
MQIKITLRFYLPEIGMEKFMDKKNKKCWWGCGRNKNSYTLFVEMQIRTFIMESSMVSLRNTEDRTTIWSSDTTPEHLNKET